MSWNVEFDEKHATVCLTFGDTVSHADVEASTRAFIAALQTHGSTRVLTDFLRTTHLALSITDIFHLPNLYLNLGLNLPLYEALICSKISKIREGVEFYKTVCRNRGVHVEIFDNRDLGLKWLSTDGETAADAAR